jgi:hypothetical protein
MFLSLFLVLFGVRCISLGCTHFYRLSNNIHFGLLFSVGAALILWYSSQAAAVQLGIINLPVGLA